MEGKVAELVEMIKGMTVLELAECKKALEEEFGVTAMAPAMMAGPAPAAGAEAEAAPEEEEQTEFDVVLMAAGEKKIQVIKVVRAITELGLKEAKALVDEAPKPVKEAISRKEAEEIRTQLEEVGATVEIK